MDENTLISLAIERSQRARYRELLSNPKKRVRLLDKLNHSPPLDERWTTWYSSFTKAINAVEIRPTTEVFLLSDAAELDGKTMPFSKAIEEVPSAGWGTIIGISPKLALYYGEQGERSAVIQKR